MSSHSRISPVTRAVVLAVIVVGAVAVWLTTSQADQGDGPAVDTASPSASGEPTEIARSTPPATPRPSPTASSTPTSTAAPPPEEHEVPRTSSGQLDFDQWSRTIPTADEVGGEVVEPGSTYALRTSEDVVGVTAVGGRSAAVRDDLGVTITDSLLGGANDGLKPSTGTTLRNSVVSVDYGEGAHADHVQVRGDDQVTIERVRLIAENTAGATDTGWNAALFIHDGSTDWTIRDVYIQAGSPGRTITSWFPVRLTSGRGTVERVVLDRGVMKRDDAFLIDDGVEIVAWEDVYIREDDGSLTPVEQPAPRPSS